MQFLNRAIAVIKPKQPAITIFIMASMLSIGIHGCRGLQPSHSTEDALEYCDVKDAYTFAVKMSKMDPNTFIKEQFDDQTVYHSKTLKFDSTSWVHVPSEGKGECVFLEKGNILATYWDVETMGKVESEETSWLEHQSLGISYFEDDGVAKIVLYGNGHFVCYSIKENSIQKVCADVKGFELGREPNEIVTKKADAKEIEPYIKMVSKLKEVYKP